MGGEIKEEKKKQKKNTERDENKNKKKTQVRNEVSYGDKKQIERKLNKVRRMGKEREDRESAVHAGSE